MLLRRHTSGREHGQVMILFALVLVLILAVTAVAVDLGMLRNNKQTLRNAMDAAAMAGGTKLPVTGPTEASAANALALSTLKANYPGLNPDASWISYGCVVGTNSSGQPDVTQITFGMCDPRHALGITPPTLPTAADFAALGGRWVSRCNPGAGDKCNIIRVIGSSTTQYAFGPVVGIMSGSSGAIDSVACGGPCGAMTVAPVDLVIILDRTLSMQGSDAQGNDKITSLQNAAYAVLKVYDPTIQRVALGTVGPSLGTTTPAPDGSATLASCPHVPNPNPTGVTGSTQVYGKDGGTINTDFGTLRRWVPVGLTGLDSGSPAASPKEAYSTPDGLNDGKFNLNNSSKIVQAISCLTAVTQGTNLTSPIQMAQAYLDKYGRPGVTQGIILETDGKPEAGPSNSEYFTCAAADDSASAAKADKKNSPDGIQIFTVSYGSAGQKCPTQAANTSESVRWSGQPATDLLKSMATDPSHFFDTPSGADLATVFQNIAITLAHGSVQLVPPVAPVITAVTPGSGSHNGGTLVTITGAFFSGAIGVTFGPAAAAFTILNDTTIQATAPGGPTGTTVDIRVTTSGGTTPFVGADEFTYTP